MERFVPVWSKFGIRDIARFDGYIGLLALIGGMQLYKVAISFAVGFIFGYVTAVYIAVTLFK